MAHRDRPFSETEQLNLLAEIIKTSSIPPAALLQVIYEHQIVPQWADVSRPPGRSASECEQVFSNLRSAFPPQPPGPSRPPTASYPPPVQPPPFLHRPWNPEPGPHQTPGAGRTIQPRPQGVPPNVYSPSGSPYATTPTEPQFKKRGRPTNAELEQRRAEAEARGETYAPQRSRKRSKATQSASTSLPPQSVKRISLGSGARPGDDSTAPGDSKRSSLTQTSSRSPPPDQTSPGASGTPSRGTPIELPPASMEPRQQPPAPPTLLSFGSDRSRVQPPPPSRQYSPPHPPPHQQGISLSHPPNPRELPPPSSRPHRDSPGPERMPPPR